MAEGKMGSLQKRIFSAAVIAPVFLAIVWYGNWPFLFLMVAVATIAVKEWHNLSLKLKHNYVTLGVGLLYILISFFCFYQFRIEFGLQIFILLAFVWASDIGGYVAGKTIGGPKLIPKISPNKTWAGLAGAVICPTLIAVVFLPYAYDVDRYRIMIGIGLLVGFFGQAGDLSISWLKRKAGVKDTSNLIPGHGGVLDRIDSLMFVTPFLYMALRALAMMGEG